MQSKYELSDICILHTDPQLDTVMITLLSTTAAQKYFSDGSSFLVLDFPPTRAGFSLGQGSQGIC